MTQTFQGQYVGEYEDRAFGESPFVEPRYENYEEPAHESTTAAEQFYEQFTVESPFETESYEGVATAVSPEVAALAEIAADLKDHEFRESLEQLADEALETYRDELAGEYGDRETRDGTAERLLSEHFYPLSAQAEATLDRFFERLEGYEAEALTDSEIERVVSEVAPVGLGFTPASEQFLGGLLKKAGKLVSGAVNLAKRGVQGAISLAGKGLAAVGKLALGPLLNGLKKLAGFLLRYVVKNAMGQLPPAVVPYARKLADSLLSKLGEAEAELEDREQTEAEAVPAGADVARLEAEFDVMASQLLLVPDEAEADRVISEYGEVEGDRSLGKLDDARAGLTKALNELEANESPQPVMEQFLPALLWPAAKTAITVMGRPKLVSFLGRLLSGLIKPMIGAQAAGLLAPTIADAGLRIFGLETEAPDPRAVTAEALAATIEETVNRVAELPPVALENETLLESAVRDAFEDAASTYFPGANIKAELRQAPDQRGMFARMPVDSPRKRYAAHTERIPVSISPRAAATVQTFSGGTLRDHLRDRMNVPPNAPLRTHARVYQVLPGATTSAIARAEGIHPRDLHPLTPHAAGALFGNNAALGPRDAVTAAHPIATPHHLHLRQRLYYLEPPNGRHPHAHARLARTEVSINLRKGEIRVWLYLSEPLCQKIAAELGRAGNAAGAFRLVQPLVARAATLVRDALHEQHLPPALRIVGETPNLQHKVPSWLTVAGRALSAKIGEWAGQQVAQFLRNNAAEFRRVSEAHAEGLTLTLTMTRVPGLETLRSASRGQQPRALQGTAWLRGEPAFAVVAHPGYAIR